MAELTLAEREELTPEQEAAATMLAARAANFAIRNAKTKFTPEQQAKIHKNAREDYLREALAKVPPRAASSCYQEVEGRREHSSPDRQSPEAEGCRAGVEALQWPGSGRAQQALDLVATPD